MPRPPDPTLRSTWQRRLKAFEAFDGTVQQFCDRLGVSTAAFYQWRRRLAPPAPFQPAKPQAAERDSPPQFVPLQLVGAHEAAEPSRPVLCVQLRGGARLELADDDPQLIQAVLNCVLEHDARTTTPQPRAAAAGGAR